jgi:hypothetical protein
MRLDGSDLERVCEYEDVCAESNYGSKNHCIDKVDCKRYWTFCDYERKIWEYVQIIEAVRDESKKTDLEIVEEEE